MQIILVRHGETNANNKKLIQGYTDNPLNNLGRQQAVAAGRYLHINKYQPDYAYSSPLSRAYETGLIILKELTSPLTIEKNSSFIERNFGPFEHQEAIPTLKKVLETGFKYPGFEDDEALIKRVKNGLNVIYNKHKEKNIIIFCHSHVIKSFLIMADPENYNYKIFIDNGSLYKFKYDGNNLILLEFDCQKKKIR